MMQKNVSIFCCYAHQNRPYYDELQIQLAGLQRKGQISLVDYEADGETIQRDLESADIVLLLISHYFFSSDVCWDIMNQAIYRQEAGKTSVIPILLSPVDYEGTPLAHLQVLPTRRKPLSKWSDRQEAWSEVVRYIRGIISSDINLRYSKLKESIFLEEDDGDKQSQAHFYKQMGDTLSEFGRYQEALAAYDRAIHLDSDLASAYNGKAKIFEQLASLNHEAARQLTSLAPDQETTHKQADQ